MKEKILFEFAYDYLKSFENINEKDIKKHLKPIYNKPTNLNSLFERLCESAQNRQMSNKVIGQSIVGGLKKIGDVTNGFDINFVCEKYKLNDSRVLLKNIVEKLEIKGKIRDTNRSLWPIFCQSIIDSAYFLKEFKTSGEFYEWADFLTKNKNSKYALPMLISVKIRGIGFALACDFLKEIGFLNFGKPDIHLIEIFKGVGLLDKTEKNESRINFLTLETMDKIADLNNRTSYEIDKIFWLIGSGNFYSTSEKKQIGRNRDKFIYEFNKYYPQQRVC